LAPVPGSRGYLGREKGYPMSTLINDDPTSLEIDGHVVPPAEFSDHAGANGQRAWTVSSHPCRLFTRNQAITAMVLTERLEDFKRASGGPSAHRPARSAG
jgi:hypothetical protein